MDYPADVDAYHAVVRPEVKYGIRLLRGERRLHRQMLAQFLTGGEEFIETEWFE